MNKSYPLIDLHRHLEGCVRIETVLELGLEHGLALPAWSVEELRPHVQVDSPMAGLVAYFVKFELMQLCMVSYEAIRRITFECLDDACSEGLDYLELRFSPVFMAEKHGLDLDGVVEAVCDGLDEALQALPMRAKLIGIMSRTYGPEMCWQELEAAIRGRDRGVVAVDVAGDEITYPGELFVNHFQRAREAGMRVTVHAGESSSAAEVEQAILELRAERLGHAVRAIDDPAVMDLIHRESVGIESCLTSNLQTCVVEDIAQHPASVYLRRGLPVTLNTDNPVIAGVDLPGEYRLAERELGLSEVELDQLKQNALRVAFLSDEERADLLCRASRKDTTSFKGEIDE
jgi:adenosine deaminase